MRIPPMEVLMHSLCESAHTTLVSAYAIRDCYAKNGLVERLGKAVPRKTGEKIDDDMLNEVKSHATDTNKEAGDFVVKALEEVVSSDNADDVTLRFLRKVIDEAHRVIHSVGPQDK